MTTYAPQAPTSAGVALTFNAASGGGDKVPPGVVLIVRNTDASTKTVSLVTNDTADGDLAVNDRVSATIAATTGINAIKVPYSPIYINPSDGLVSLTWSATTGVTFAVISAG